MSTAVTGLVGTLVLAAVLCDANGAASIEPTYGVHLSSLMWNDSLKFGECFLKLCREVSVFNSDVENQVARSVQYFLTHLDRFVVVVSPILDRL